MKLTKTTLCILLASASLAFAASAEADPWTAFYTGINGVRTEQNHI